MLLGLAAIESQLPGRPTLQVVRAAIARVARRADVAGVEPLLIDQHERLATSTVLRRPTYPYLAPPGKLDDPVGHCARLDDDPPPLTTHTAFTQWEFAPVVTIGVIVVVVIYLVGVGVVRRRHPNGQWPIRWTVSFMAGNAVIVIATQSSIGAYDDVLFWIHMVQHILLLMVAPPLLLLGRPVTLLLHATRNPVHTTIKRIVRSAPINVITFPLLGVLLYIATVVGTHLTDFMNVTLQHPVAHDLEHVLYLVVGYLYFLPLIGREPIRWRLSFTTRCSCSCSRCRSTRSLVWC